MQKQKAIIINKLGLHIRAASALVAKSSRYSSEIHILYENQKVDAKSIMALLLLAAAEGSELEIVTSGEDEMEALEAIVQLINDRFGENE